MDKLAENVMAVQKRVWAACQRAGRGPDSVQVVAISKGQPANAIKALYELGQRDFGENYVSEWWTKKHALADSCPHIRWHFVGKMQSTHAKRIAACELLHSVDSLEHARSISRHRSLLGVDLECFLQVNLDESDGRVGFSCEGLIQQFDALIQVPFLRIIGLMAVLPQTGDSAQWFSAMCELQDRLQLPELSMGMSQDFEAAIAAGATWVRLGTLLFGPR